MSEWRPIETAPKDGTVILLRCSIERLCAYASSVRHKKEIAIGYYGKWWVTGVPGGHCEGGGDSQFTHWMPLPEPPKIKPIPVNVPFERVPQHASDPGFGPVPPKPNIVNLRDEPQQPFSPIQSPYESHEEIKEK